MQIQDETEKCDLKHRTRKQKPHRRNKMKQKTRSETRELEDGKQNINHTIKEERTPTLI
jgi:hypothetical protein